MVQCRSISKEEINNMWRVPCGMMEEEVLEKCKVEETEKGPCKERGDPSEWRSFR